MSQEAVSIPRSRWSSAISFLGGAAFVAVGLFLMFGEHSPAARTPREVAVMARLACVFFFGWSSFVGLLGLLRRRQLILSSQGYKLSGVVDGPVMPWSEVSFFETSRIFGTTVVKAHVNASSERGIQSGHKKWLSTLLDGDPLAGSSLKPKDLVETLERWRARYS